MDIGKIKKAIDRDYNWILSEEGSFGRWIIGIWLSYDGLSFPEQKEAFFILLKKLLDDGKIVLRPPIKFYDKKKKVYSLPTRKVPEYITEEFVKEIGQVYWRVWNESSDTIVNYMRNVFPKNAADEDDLDINDFWYSTDCPIIGWVRSEDGKIVGS